MTLSVLFSRCVQRSYLRTPAFGDYACDRVGSHIYLYFQDSDGAVDWARNLDFPAAAYRRHGKTAWHAHRGFLKAWELMIPYIEGWVADPSVDAVTVVGYSHGAALALLCHEYVWYHRPDLRAALEGYGFGCPRVLWGRISPELASRWESFTVIRNKNDVVTFVPPRFLGYTHVGILLEIGTAGKYSAVDAHRAEAIRRELWIYEGAAK